MCARTLVHSSTYVRARVPAPFAYTLFEPRKFRKSSTVDAAHRDVSAGFWGLIWPLLGIHRQVEGADTQPHPSIKAE
jgi:hypothetical protein